MAICQKTTGFYPHSFPGPLFRRERDHGTVLILCNSPAADKFSKSQLITKKLIGDYFTTHQALATQRCWACCRQACSFAATERSTQAAHTCMMNSSQKQSGINLVNHSCHSKYSSSTRLFDARL